MAFLMEIFFPGGTQPSLKITEIPGDGGGGLTSTLRMEIPGGWGSKTKVPFVGGVWIFLELHISGSACHIPPPPSPGISVIIQLGCVPPGRNNRHAGEQKLHWDKTNKRHNICVKNVVALYYYAKDNNNFFPVIKLEKILSYMLIPCLMISRTFSGNN